MPKKPPFFEVIFEGTMQPPELHVGVAPIVIGGLHALASKEYGKRDYTALARHNPRQAYELLHRELLWMSEHVQDLESTVKGNHILLSGTQDGAEATNRTSRRRMDYILGRADPTDITFDVDLWRLKWGVFAAKRIVRFQVPGPSE